MLFNAMLYIYWHSNPSIPFAFKTNITVTVKITYNSFAMRCHVSIHIYIVFINAYVYALCMPMFCYLIKCNDLFTFQSLISITFHFIYSAIADYQSIVFTFIFIHKNSQVSSRSWGDKHVKQILNLNASKNIIMSRLKTLVKC